MANAAENPLPAQYVERPRNFRTTVVFPETLRSFILTQANQTKYRWQRGANVSAFLRDLVEEKQAALVKRKRK